MHRTAVLLIHLAAALVPMALGWGVRDLSQFVAEPARAGLLLAMAAGAVAVFLLGIDLNPLRPGERATHLETGRDTKPETQHEANHDRWTLTALALASLALLWFLPFADRRHILVIHSPELRWLGLSLCLAGGAVRILALRQLGPQFSAYVTLQPGHRLVQSGIYSRVRHPLYLSLLLAGPGVALVFASQLVWPILLAAALFVAGRIREEERLLNQQFGRQFDAYRKRSRALIPLLW